MVISIGGPFYKMIQKMINSWIAKKKINSCSLRGDVSQYNLYSIISCNLQQTKQERLSAQCSSKQSLTSYALLLYDSHSNSIVAANSPLKKNDYKSHPIQSACLKSAKSSPTIKEMSSLFNRKHQGIQFHKHLKRWGTFEGGGGQTHWCIAYICHKIFMNIRLEPTHTHTHTHTQLIL